MSNSQARVEEVFAEAARLFASKNVHYGDSWRDQGWRGNISRILEKAKRLKNMLWRGGNVLLNGSSEHPRETMLDMINTLAFAIINMDDDVEWGSEPQAREIRPPMQVPDWVRETEHPPVRYGESAGEQTMVAPHVGNVPVPGEEPPSPKPRRQKPVGEGSGPRSRPVGNNQA